MAGGQAWWGGMCGDGVGVCMAGGHASYVHPPADTTGNGQ